MPVINNPIPIIIPASLAPNNGGAKTATERITAKIPTPIRNARDTPECLPETLVVVIARKNFEHNEKYSITHQFDAGAAWENLALEALDDAAAYNHDKLNWIGVCLSPSLSNWAKDNMVNVDSDSTIWHRNIPHKQLPYEGLVLNWPKMIPISNAFQP